MAADGDPDVKRIAFSPRLYLWRNSISYDLVKGPIHDRWIEEAEAKGLPAKALYNEVIRMLKK